MAHRARALGHPAFVASLALLILNDHWLKHAGVLPGWLTGKLSDFAGLVVAPVVLVALLGLEDRRTRALAFSAVGAVFAALELSPRAAAGWDAALGALGVPSRSWADPTDLLALSVLPIAWAIVRAGDRAMEGEPRPLALATRQALLGVALFACVATSAPPPELPPQWTTDAWVRNRTVETLAVRIRWARGPLDCRVLASGDVDIGAAASPELFVDGITFQLAPGDTVPIEPNDADAAAAGRFPPGGGVRPAPISPRRPCELARISVDGLDESIVFWEAGDVRTISTSQPEREGEEDTTERMELAIDESAREGGLRLRPGAGYRVAVLRDRPAPGSAECGDLRGETLGVGGAARDGLHGRVVSRALLPDGCTVLEVSEAPDAAPPMTEPPVTEPLVLCVREDFVPWVEGDAIVVAIDSSGRVHLSDEEGAELPRSLTIVTSAPSVAAGYGFARPQAPALGCAERLGCGAFVAPIPALELDGSELVLPVGEVVEEPRDGERILWLVSRAEHVIVASDGCDGGRDREGARIDAAVLIETLAPPAGEGEEEVP